MKNFIIIALTFILSSFVVLPSVVVAQTSDQDAIVDTIEQRSDPNDDTSFGLPRFFTGDQDGAVQNILATVFVIAGGLSVLFIAVGGLRYVLSEGNDQKIQQAKDTITYAIVGFVVSLSGFLVVRFFLGIIT